MPRSASKPQYALRVHPNVQDALQSNRPVVALETSIVTQGMPYPVNLKAAQACEASIRANGATPATCAILGGIPTVGCTSEELHQLAELARNNATNLRKVAKRDIAKCVADGAFGGTTVSGTIVLAEMAGVTVFATGGIGGVHRGVNESFDISADLWALAQANMLVVCAGVKTVLDIPKTLEALETASVCVLTLNPEDGEFPSFYTRKSGVRTPDAVSTEREAAGVVHVQLNVNGPGTLLAVPVPKQFEADHAVIAAAVQESIAESEKRGVTGREATPFLLGRIAEITKNHSLHANVELVKNNAAVAARIAGHLCSLKLGLATTREQPKQFTLGPNLERVDVVVVGGCAVDITAAGSKPLRRGTSNLGRIDQALGGVGLNVLRAVSARGVKSLLISGVGKDLLGSFVRSQMNLLGITAAGVDAVPGSTTATYVALNGPNGDLDTAVADMSIFEGRLPAISGAGPSASLLFAALGSARFLCLDGNLHPEDISTLCRQGRALKLSLWFEPVSLAKCRKIFIGSKDSFAALSYVSPNSDELAAMWSQMQSSKGLKTESTPVPADEMALDLLNEHHRLGGENLCIVCTVGAKGVYIYQREQFRETEGNSSEAKLSRVHIPAAPIPGGVIRSTNGAGDVFAGTVMGELVKNGASLVKAVQAGVTEAAEHCAGGFRVSRM